MNLRNICFNKLLFFFRCLPWKWDERSERISVCPDFKKQNRQQNCLPCILAKSSYFYLFPSFPQVSPKWAEDRSVSLCQEPLSLCLVFSTGIIVGTEVGERTVIGPEEWTTRSTVNQILLTALQRGSSTPTYKHTDNTQMALWRAISIICKLLKINFADKKYRSLHLTITLHVCHNSAVCVLTSESQVVVRIWQVSWIPRNHTRRMWVSKNL